MKKIIPVIIAVALIVLIGALYAGRMVTDKYSYSRERADLASYFGVKGDSQAAILLNDEWIDARAGIFDGGCYLAFSDMDSLLCSRFYYGEQDQVLLYTLPDAIVSTEIGSRNWTSTDGTQGTMDYPLARMEGDDLWILLDYATRFSRFNWELFGGEGEPWRVRIVTEWTSFQQAAVAKKTELRILGGVKSEILRDLDKGDKVVILEEMENWSKVRTQDAFIGYIENKRLGEPITMDALGPAFEEPVYTSITKPYPVNMAWHAVYAVAGNDTLDELVAATDAGKENGLNTIAPTWFSLCDGACNIADLSSEA